MALASPGGDSVGPLPLRVDTSMPEEKVPQSSTPANARRSVIMLARAALSGPYLLSSMEKGCFLHRLRPDAGPLTTRRTRQNDSAKFTYRCGIGAMYQYTT